MKARGIITLACVCVFAVCLLNSDTVAEQSVYYIRLCAFRVVPSLFVFSVLSAVICQSGAFYKLCGLPVFGTEAAVLLLGLLGGFPLGASMAVSLYENGSVNKKQAQYICAFANTPSLSFILSYTAGVLNSRRSGILLAVLSAVSALLVALVFKYAYLGKNERYLHPRPAIALPKSFAKTLTDTAFSMVVVCGCIVFFGSIGSVFPSTLASFFEISGGISQCSNAVQAAVLLGFSGFSVMLQIAAVCDGKLSALPYIAAAIARAAIMFAAACLFNLFF